MKYEEISKFMQKHEKEILKLFNDATRDYPSGLKISFAGMLASTFILNTFKILPDNLTRADWLSTLLAQISEAHPDLMKTTYIRGENDTIN